MVKLPQLSPGTSQAPPAWAAEPGPGPGRAGPAEPVPSGTQGGSEWQPRGLSGCASVSPPCARGREASIQGILWALSAARAAGKGPCPCRNISQPSEGAGMGWSPGQGRAGGAGWPLAPWGRVWNETSSWPEPRVGKVRTQRDGDRGRWGGHWAGDDARAWGAVGLDGNWSCHWKG